MATALTLLVLGAVVQVFGTVSESISDARSFVEKVDQLRITQRQLKQDLEGETAPTTPPSAPELGLGYFEYVEGPLGRSWTSPPIRRHSTAITTTSGTARWATSTTC